MGCTASKDATAFNGTKEEQNLSRKIDSTLRKEKKGIEHEIKLLLLGAGESGKSTIIKQMKILYLRGFTEEERKAYIDIIYSNTIMAMKTIVAATKAFDLKISEKFKEYEDIFNVSDESLYGQRLTNELATAIRELWSDSAIQEAYSRSSSYQLIDSAKYFFENVDRLGDAEYLPTTQDLLQARTRTTGISEIDFELLSVKWRVFDVGGQRNERKKWIHCFHGVTALIFCVAISEYDLKLFEDEKVNRMHESLVLFEEIVNCQWFDGTSIVLFLNKYDIFKEKIQKVDLKVCFDDYTGGCNKEVAAEFIRSKFLKLNRNNGKLYAHLTCATDTENFKKVFEAVKDIIARESLQGSDLI